MVGPEQTYYQVLYRENGQRLFEVYHHSKKVHEFPYALQTPFQEAFEDVCGKVNGSAQPIVHLHSHPACKTSQQQLLELEKRVGGRSVTIKGRLVWIGGPLSSVASCQFNETLK